MILRTLVRHIRHLRIRTDISESLFIRHLKTSSVNKDFREDYNFTEEAINVHNLDSSLSEFIPISHVKQCLVKNGITFNDGYTCLILDCFLCSEKKFKLYINKVTGYFICYGCNSSGNWADLEPYVRDPTQKCVPQADERMSLGNKKWLKVKKHLQHVNELSQVQISDLLERISLPNLHLDILNKLDVHVDMKNQDIYVPLCYDDQNSVIGYKILYYNLEEESCPIFGAGGLIKIKIGQSESALLVHRLRDLLALSTQDLKGYDIISLPHGQFSLPQAVLPLLEHYSKLVLWFGNDVTSWDNARQFSRKLSEQRCYLVRPLDHQKSALNAVENNLHIPTILKDAQKITHASIITFANLREDIIAELYNADKVSGVKWDRFPALNTILKGHRRGELTILTGPTGSGKTTFMSEYSLDLAIQKVTTLWGSFEIRNQRLARTMLQQMALSPLTDNLHRFDEWADRFEQLPIYFMTFYGQQPLEIVMEAVKHASYVHDVAHVIIDNVQFMLGMSPNESGFLDRFYKQDALIGNFRNFATTHNCHVTLVIHPRKEREGEPLALSSIFGGAKASQEADNVLIIQNKTNMTALKVKKFLQIAKNRFSGDLGMMPLDFNRESLSFMSKANVNRN